MPIGMQPVNKASHWQEEFLLNAFLMYNYAFKPFYAGRYMWETEKDTLFRVLGTRDTQSSDAAFWFERVV